MAVVIDVATTLHVNGASAQRANKATGHEAHVQVVALELAEVAVSLVEEAVAEDVSSPLPNSTTLTISHRYRSSTPIVPQRTPQAFKLQFSLEARPRPPCCLKIRLNRLWHAKQTRSPLSRSSSRSTILHLPLFGLASRFIIMFRFSSTSVFLSFPS